MMRLLAILAVVFAAGAAAYAAVGTADRSLAVYPKQEIPLRFDHALHLEDDADCTSCHDADVSTKVGDRLIPGHPACESCHDIEAAQAGEETDPPASCAVCHPGFEPTAMKAPKAVDVPAANLKFNHKVHVDKEIACERCHGSFEKVELATRQQLPKMATCLECHHPGGEAAGDCSVCHLQGIDGRLKTSFASGELVPELGNPFGIYHGPDYYRNHEHDAHTARQTCGECHNESECLACHDAAIKSLKVHPNDWMTLHPVPAKHNSLECSSCHNYQSFCATCHERIGIGQQSAAELRAQNLSVHPPEWNGPIGPQHHGVWASRDISSCASCHREEGCIQCHATTGRGGLGASPHPAGFRQQACGILQKNARVCLKCHSPTSSEISRCL